MLHETLIWLYFADILSQKLQAVAKLHTLVAYQIGKDEGSTATLTLNRVDEDLATAAESFIDVPISDAEVLFHVFMELKVFNRISGKALAAS